jgi:hypothetical protein
MVLNRPIHDSKPSWTFPRTGLRSFETPDFIIRRCRLSGFSERLYLKRVTNRTRTGDIQNHNLALYQLSYSHHILQQKISCQQLLNVYRPANDLSSIFTRPEA